MTIATGNERADFVDNQVVPTSDRQIVVDYAAAEQRDLGNAIIADQADSDGTGVVLGQPVALLDAGSAGERVLSIVGTSPHPAVGWWGRRLANLNPSATNPGLEDVPFEDDETNVYQVGLRHNLIPTGVTALLDSTYVYHRHKHALGEQVTPAAVVINGSTLEIELPANNNFHPWADAGATRKVTVWLVAPETADPNYAVWTGDATSDGSTIDIVVPHHFGQGSASETEADYVVHVHGLSINRADDLRDDADANGLQRYLVLCDYDSAGDTYDYSQQVAVDSLQKLVAKVDAIPSFDSAIRAGAYIGTPQVTREWGYPSGWTVDDTTDPLTITIPDWSSAADHFVVTGDIANGLAPRLCASAGSLVASFAAALPAARYALLLVAVPDGITPNIYTTEYLVTNEAALTGDQLRRCLQIAAFDYDGSQPSLSRVTNISWVDLNTRRGWLDPRALGSGTGALGLEVEEVNAALNNGTLFKVMARLLPATATDHTFGEAFRVERASNTNTRAQVGKGAALADGESADIALGDPATDYLWRAARSGSARTLVGGSAGAEWFRHERASGGAASGGSGRAMVEDLHLLGYKQVIVHDPIHGARGSLRSQGGTHRVLASDLTLGVTTSAFATALSDATLNLEGQVLRVGDVLRVTMLAECHDYTTPTTPVEVGFDVGGVTIWSASGDPGATGAFVWVQADILITAIGSAGTYRASIRATSSDATDNPWNRGGATTHNGLIFTSATGSINTLTGGAMQAFGRNTVLLGAAGVTLRQFTVEHMNAGDGWIYSGSTGMWTCPVGDGRILDIPLDGVRLANAGTAQAGAVDQVTVYCGENGGAADQLDLTVYSVHRETGALTSLGTGSQTGTGSAITITLSGPPDIDPDEYLMLRAETVHGQDGTVPNFFVRSVRHRERVYELR